MAHGAVGKIIHVYATVILPCENNKHKCGFLDLRDCYTDMWICRTITVTSVSQTGKAKGTELFLGGRMGVCALWSCAILSVLLSSPEWLQCLSWRKTRHL